ncbi:ABC transporter substrate-binding protein [Actinomadura fulvescens]|uniref:ABC transporter substrate-binding protein n=1 Tax=Actinomadura fulvescens TaxID=46160 RepID=A0ABP6CFX8_9ACTN
MAGEARRATAGLLGLAMGLTGCGGGGGDSEGTNAGPPRDGGTLRIIGSSDVDHLDTASANSTGAHGLNRTYARTLFGTRASNEFKETVPVQADVAARVPSKENGGISKDGRTYTIKLREGVRWNTRPPRPVVAADFVRGIERLCNPASPAGGLAYYVSTIRGMDGYCRGFAKVNAKDADTIAAYQNKHAIPGVQAKGDDTLVFKLRRPASDFLNLLTLQFTAAAPKEYDAYVPDSPEFRQHTISNGPYQITSYKPGLSYVLSHNPAWRQETDPLRERHVEKIQLTLGQDSPDTVQQQLEQGTADLSWDQPVPVTAISRLRGSQDDRFAIRDTPSSSPYLVFNTRGRTGGGALARREVRQALQYAVDRTTLIKIVGGPEVAEPLHTIIPPGNAGHFASNRYATPGESGDPVRCRLLLAKAGAPKDLTLKFPYRVQGTHKRIAESIKESLGACGVKAELIPDTGGNYYGKTLADPAKARDGVWDIAAPGWTPDWYGNNGRSLIQPLFDGRTYGPNSTNFGGYDNPQVNALIDSALTASDQGRAAGYWQLADQKIMEDAAVIPLLNRALPIFRSARVRGARYLPTATGYDYTRLWLAS